MLEAPRPADETARLRSLQSLAILDTEFERRFDRITRVAAAALEVPIALVSLVDENRQWFKSCVGLDARETPRSVSFCGHAIASDEVFIIEDAHHDARFFDNPLVVREPFVRFYAGQPLDDGAGHKLGTLCLIDRRPRSLSTAQIGLLQELGTWAEEELRSNGLDHALTRQRDTERRLEAIAATLLDGLVTTDAEGRIKSLNPAAERIFGYERVEAIGRDLSMFLDDPVFPAPAEAVGEPGRHHPAGGGREVVGRRKDGSRFPLELSLSRVGSGEHQVLLGITRDISDRRNAEEALRRSEELHRSVIDAMKEGICIRDGSGAVVASNPAAAEILGVTTEQLDGRALMDPRWRTLHEDGTPFPEADHPAKVAAATGHACTGVVMGIHTPDDRLRWIEVDAQPLLRDGSPVPWAVVSTFSDITDRRAIDRMKSEFVSVVSHELRTPLTSIRGALGLLAGGGLGTVPETAQRMLDIAVVNTDRLIRLINDILDIERIESGKTNLTKQLCDAAELIVNAVEVMRPMAEKADVTLTIDAHSTSCGWTRIASCRPSPTSSPTP